MKREPQIGELEVQLAAFGFQLAKPRVQLDELGTQLGELEVQLGELEVQLGELRTQLGELEVQLDELRTQLDGLRVLKLLLIARLGAKFLEFVHIMSRPTWLKSENTLAALQLQTLATNFTAPLALSLGVSSAERDDLLLQIRLYSFEQLELIPAAEAFYRACVKTRDLHEIDKTPETLVLPSKNIIPDPPADLVGLQFSSDWFNRLNVLFKRVMLNPACTTQVKNDLGLDSSAPKPPAQAKITGHRERMGGQITILVSKGSAYGSRVEASVDGGPFEKKVEWTTSELNFTVPAGTPHALEVRAIAIDRNGASLGDYTPILSFVSQP